MSTDRSDGNAARSEGDHDELGAPPDPERLRRRLRRRTDAIERREVAEAVSVLDARGDLTDDQRETVREFGSALVEALTAAPEQALERAARTEGARERGRARAVRRLFDLDEV
ncbi:glutamyl-tRNA reductase [Halorubrum saccharovorum DSM 1137]|uniref:Glutamyl-tRNA reductase n=1 Tax=Halorubrum saccharovorum DSM 1137 TaxID=1227484 RepID=M0E8S2_9EURY|nr:glutamyl-tRNA reductase [Halorubrum saccharovorum]ELZ42784.1 glutamyl-tRNA reductase [Halorubrum saccharovorum DSM 1137]